ncbi:MAG: acyl-CoA synthetase [Pseudomonadota bacterium]
MKIQSLADIEAFEQVPAEARWRGRSVYDMIVRSVEKYADRPALKFQTTAALDEAPRIISYRDLLTAIHQCANALHSSGVSIGGVTSVIMPNLPETGIGMWGAQALGIVGPINPMLEPNALRDIMQESDAEALIVEGPVEGSNIWEKTFSILDDVPGLKTVFWVAVDGGDMNVPDTTSGGIPIVEFSSALASQEGTKLAFERHVELDDVAAYFHTGGTTGRPKIARHSHANQIHTASMMADMFDYGEHTVAIGGLPLFHVNSFFNAGLNPLACGGHSVYLTSAGFRNRDVVANLWPLLAKYKATYFATVPTVVSSLLDVPLGDHDLSSMEFIICGAAPIAPQVFSQFQDLVGITVLEAYGMTEGSLFSAGNPQFGEKRVGSIGVRVPYQPMKCVIFDETGQYVRDCKTDEIGTIVFKGPNVFLGYKQEDKNKDAFINSEWLISGDLARQDVDGYFWMTGRSKDLIIRGGHNIDPKGIEDTLSAHPAVALAAAVGQPDSYAGELPCAYVTLSEEFQGPSPSADELKVFAKANVPERAAAPVHVEIIDTMPTTAVGKIFKPDIRLLATQRVLESEAQKISPDARVTVSKSDRHGMLATVSGIGEDDTDTVSEALDRFAVAFELDRTGTPQLTPKNGELT